MKYIVTHPRGGINIPATVHWLLSQWDGTPEAGHSLYAAFYEESAAYHFFRYRLGVNTDVVMNGVRVALEYAGFPHIPREERDRLLRKCYGKAGQERIDRQRGRLRGSSACPSELSEHLQQRPSLLMPRIRRLELKVYEGSKQTISEDRKGQ